MIVDRIELILLGIVAFLFYMTFYTLYGYKVEKDVMRKFREEIARMSKELGIKYKIVKPNAARLGRHYVVIEPAPRYNPITTRIMKRKGLLKEFIYIQTRLSVPKNVEMLFIPKTQKRLLSKYAGLVAQLNKIALIEGFVTAANDPKLMEKIVRRRSKTFAKLASYKKYVRYVYLENAELESSFELETDELYMIKDLFLLHDEIANVFEEELSRYVFNRLRSLRPFGPRPLRVSFKHSLIERYVAQQFPDFAHVHVLTVPLVYHDQRLYTEMFSY